MDLGSQLERRFAHDRSDEHEYLKVAIPRSFRNISPILQPDRQASKLTVNSMPSLIFAIVDRVKRQCYCSLILLRAELAQVGCDRRSGRGNRRFNARDFPPETLRQRPRSPDFRIAIQTISLHCGYVRVVDL